MKRQDYLVCLKGNTAGFSVAHCNTEFIPHKAYRCIELSEGNQTEMLVNGVVFDKEEFEQLFEYVLDRAKRHFAQLGLLIDGEPVTKNKFKGLADIHQYGRGKSMLNIIFFHGFFDNDKVMYGFYPICKGDSKARCINNAYDMFIEFLNGESDDFDCGDIQFGNRGIPICYGDIGSWYVDTTKRLF